MISIVAVVFVLGLLIFFHELGHFLVAKLLGIGVKTFSLGFGTRLFGVVIGRTEYRISLIPLGGYVKLYGEEEGDEDLRFDEDEDFSKRPPHQRMLVILAGPVFNLILAWILYFFIFLNVGQEVLSNKVGDVVPDSPAHSVGIKKGDEIVSINGKKVRFWHDIVEIITDTKKYPLSVEVKREDEYLLFKITPKMEKVKNIFGEEIEVPKIGIVASDEWIHVQLTPFESLKSAFTQTWVITKLTFEGIVKLIERVIPLETIGGPIMIAQLVSKQAKAGVWELLTLTALISINLGVLNLLPIPVLDGGHILFCLLEIIIRRPLSPKIMEVAAKIGFAILILLMMFAVYNDIKRMIVPH